jgi:hypothetical protein
LRREIMPLLSLLQPACHSHRPSHSQTCSRLWPSARARRNCLFGFRPTAAIALSSSQPQIIQSHPTIPLSPFPKYSYRHSRHTCLLSLLPDNRTCIASCCLLFPSCIFPAFFERPNHLLLFRLVIHLNNHDGRNNHFIHRVMLSISHNADSCSSILAIPCFNKA